jgi:hypothetical protein
MLPLLSMPYTVYKTENTAVGIRQANDVPRTIRKNWY